MPEALSFGALRDHWNRASKRLAPHPYPLPACTLMRRTASWDTRGEGVPSRLVSYAVAGCVHALGLETAATAGARANSSQLGRLATNDRNG